MRTIVARGYSRLAQGKPFALLAIEICVRWACGLPRPIAQSYKAKLMRLSSLAMLLWASIALSRAQSNLTIAAAADLRPAFTELKPLFEKSAGVKLVFVFGSSGLLAKQAAEAAPFDTLFSANEALVAALEKSGKLVAGSRTLYGVGRLAIVARKGVRLPKSVQDLAKSAVGRIAIANPAHAPYGAAAKEALQHSKQWDQLAKRLVLGENVQQTLQYVDTGNVDVAMVALSLVIRAGRPFTLVPEKLHAPIRQAAGVLVQSRQPDVAKRFIRFVVGPEGRKVMSAYGFTLPKPRK